MQQSSRFLHKVSGLAIGFFGWAICHNICFVAWMFLSVYISKSTWMFGFYTYQVMFLMFFVGFAFLLAKKKIWIGLGSSLAIIVSSAMWEFNTPGMLAHLGLRAILLPFPLGFYMFVDL